MSNSESDTDDDMIMVKKKECTYFCPRNDEGRIQFEQAQTVAIPSVNMATFTQVDVFDKIHTEVNTDRFLCQIRHLTLAMVEGKPRTLYFVDRLFSNPIVTFVESKNQDVILIFHVKCNKYYCIFGKLYLELLDDLYKDVTLLQDLRDKLIKNNNYLPLTLESPDGQVNVASEEPVGTTTTHTVGTAQDGFSPFKSVVADLQYVKEFIEKQYFKITAVAELPLQPRMKTSANFDPKLPFSTISRERRTTYTFTMDKVGYVSPHGTFEVWNHGNR